MVNCVTDKSNQVTEMFPTPALGGDGGFPGLRSLRMPVSLFGVFCIHLSHLSYTVSWNASTEFSSQQRCWACCALCASKWMLSSMLTLSLTPANRSQSCFPRQHWEVQVDVWQWPFPAARLWTMCSFLIAVQCMAAVWL